MFGVKEIDAEGLKKMLDDGEDIRLIDVRSQGEYQQGIIEGGEFLPLHTLPMHINDMPDDKTIVFYCRTGARSGQACAFLKQNTGIEALNLSGGIVRWYQSGYPVTQPKAKEA
ncbi:MAG: Sulfurtransferase [uncultured Thiotrichaceae bacterium]|uniref:Sulfurtransferase n=1 Tax=uncultured Thiotrichaceae bacterium TaxID=298394 RepID=A0A6S6UF06_9GAMM|nr:MAG: Sulfurtransferase [uncultured Thiotrichaceae bacterium]